MFLDLDHRINVELIKRGIELSKEDKEIQRELDRKYGLPPELKQLLIDIDGWIVEALSPESDEPINPKIAEKISIKTKNFVLEEYKNTLDMSKVGPATKIFFDNEINEYKNKSGAAKKRFQKDPVVKDISVDEAQKEWAESDAIDVMKRARSNFKSNVYDYFLRTTGDGSYQAKLCDFAFAKAWKETKDLSAALKAGKDTFDKLVGKISPPLKEKRNLNDIISHYIAKQKPVCNLVRLVVGNVIIGYYLFQKGSFNRIGRDFPEIEITEQEFKDEVVKQILLAKEEEKNDPYLKMDIDEFQDVTDDPDIEFIQESEYEDVTFDPDIELTDIDPEYPIMASDILTTLIKQKVSKSNKLAVVYIDGNEIAYQLDENNKYYKLSSACTIELNEEELKKYIHRSSFLREKEVPQKGSIEELVSEFNKKVEEEYQESQKEEKRLEKERAKEQVGQVVTRSETVPAEMKLE